MKASITEPVGGWHLWTIILLITCLTKHVISGSSFVSVWWLWSVSACDLVDVTTWNYIVQSRSLAVVEIRYDRSPETDFGRFWISGCLHWIWSYEVMFFSSKKFIWGWTCEFPLMCQLILFDLWLELLTIVCVISISTSKTIIFSHGFELSGIQSAWNLFMLK